MGEGPGAVVHTSHYTSHTSDISDECDVFTIILELLLEFDPMLSLLLLIENQAKRWPREQVSAPHRATLFPSIGTD